MTRVSNNSKRSAGGRTARAGAQRATRHGTNTGHDANGVDDCGVESTQLATAWTLQAEDLSSRQPGIEAAGDAHDNIDGPDHAQVNLP